MRKFRNARAVPVAARRPDGLPNRALARTMSPAQLLADGNRVVSTWYSIAAALVPGAVTK
jgi:hypothetical protein